MAVLLDGLSSEETVGDFSFLLPVPVQVDGIQSEETIGDVSLVVPVLLGMDGLPSEEIAGDIDVGEVPPFILDGLPSEEAIGFVHLPGLPVDGISSEEALGDLVFLPLKVDGLPSEEAIGDTYFFPILMDGIQSEEALGTIHFLPILIDGLPSSEAVGDVALITAILNVDGLQSEEVTGNTVVAETFTTDGIQSEEVFGNLRLLYEPAIGATDKRVFGLILTGAENSLDDLDLSDRMSSFSCRRRDAEPTSLQVVLKGAESIAPGIAARPDGQLIVTMSIIRNDGTLKGLSEIARTDMDTIQESYGPSTSSINLSGFQTRTYSAPTSLTLSHVTSKQVSSGFRSFQVPYIHFSMMPGDTVTYGIDTFIVKRLSYSVTENQTVMTVSEVA